MNKLIILIMIMLISACNSNHQPRMMSAMEVMGQINNDFCVLIDIREQKDIQEMATPAKLIPLSAFNQNFNDLTTILNVSLNGKLMVLYSNTSDEAKGLCDKLVKKNYKCNYLESFEDWKKNNLPVKPIN